MRLIAVLTISLCLCGCVAKSSHVERGDRVVSDLCAVLSNLHPEDRGLHTVSLEAAAVAKADASVLPRSTGYSLAHVAAGVMGGAGPLGLIAAGLLKSYIAARKREEDAYELANEAAEMSPEEAKKHVKKRRRK